MELPANTFSILAVVIGIFIGHAASRIDFDIVKLFIAILLKYIPGITAPLKRVGDIYQIPELKIGGEDTITKDDVETFEKAVPSTAAAKRLSPFLLLCKTTPVVIAMLADRRCPIKPLGAVNTRNVVKCKGFQLGAIKYIATLGGGQAKKRGVEFCITLEVWQKEKVMHAELWFLQFMKTGVPEVINEKVEAPLGEKYETLELTTKHPRLWAASCKDYNPIHVSTTAAKLFGFQSTIAHGNHVAALVAEGPEMEIEFVRPMMLPGQYEVYKNGSTYTVVGKKTNMVLKVTG